MSPFHPQSVTRAGIRKALECKGRETWPISKGGVGKAFLKVSTELNVEETRGRGDGQDSIPKGGVDKLNLTRRIIPLWLECELRQRNQVERGQIRKDATGCYRAQVVYKDNREPLEATFVTFLLP